MHSVRTLQPAEWALDHVIEDSFPASDPPSWTFGVPSRAPLADAGRAVSDGVTASNGGDVVRVDLDVIVPGDSAWPILRGLATLAEAAAVALLIPLAVLLVGLPVVLVVRGIAEGIGWLLPRFVG